MAKTITIQQSHTLGRDAAYHRVAAWQEKVRQKYSVTATWRAPTPEGALLAELGGKVAGWLWVRESDVCIQLTLGGIAGLFASKIENGLREQLIESLG
mgnify:FL=1